MNFYKHFLGDYARDTADLTLLEHGAYRVLLDHYYAQHGNLGADKIALFRICKAFTPAERRAVEGVAERFFAINGDGRRHNHRADEEIQKHLGQAAANQIVAEERERKRREHKSLLDGVDDPSTNRAPSHSQKPEEAKTSVAAQRKAATASQAHDCPHEKLISLYHELLPDCLKLEKLTPSRRALIRARWRDEAKPNRDKHRGYTTAEEGLAYWRRFFGWCAESQFLTGLAPGKDGRPPFVASLPWLLKAENFAKAIEGTYHR